MSSFNPHVSTMFIIKNKQTDEIKVIDSRRELVEFIRKEVNINEAYLEKFNKDLNTLQKEDLLNKYLKNWYQVKK